MTVCVSVIHIYISPRILKTIILDLLFTVVEVEEQRSLGGNIISRLCNVVSAVLIYSLLVLMD